VVKVFGAGRLHHAFLFTNKVAIRIKMLIYDGWFRCNKAHLVKSAI
jgi:hypothetical protein